MRLASAAILVSVLALVPSVMWLIGGMLGVLPTAHLSIGGSTGERTLAGVAVASCIVAAIACWKVEQEVDQ